MAHIDSRQLLGSAALLVLPVLVVQMTSYLSGQSGPARTDASTNPVLPIELQVIDDVVRNLTPEQRTALDHIQDLHIRSFGPTPFYYRPERTVAPITVEPDPDAEKPAPEVTLRMVMTGRTGDIALIDDRKYREGDTIIETDWAVVEIDGLARVVVIEQDATGRREVLRVVRPD